MQRLINELKPHELNSKLYGVEELPESFISSVREKGILIPLAIKHDGTIISGHRRWQAAKIVGMKTVSVVVVEYQNELDEREAIIEYNRQREKTFSQKMAEAEELEAIERERARQRMMMGKSIEPCGNISTGLKGKTRDKVAKAIGIGSGRTYDKAVKVWETAKKNNQAIDIVEKLDQGKISIDQAYQTVRKLEKLKAVEEKFVSKTEETKSIDIYNTDKKYNIIYADPPWQYWEGGQKNQSLHYNTMTIEEICELPVKNIADNDCILFLWVTYPILQECFKVIEAWGFKYSTAGFVWVKKNKNTDTPFIGCGSWTRANTELCLIATKGSVLRLDASISQVIESPIEEHSKKPAVTRELITKLVGELPRIELFSRQAADGWDCWGNEV